MPSPFRGRVAGLAVLFSTVMLGPAPAFGQGEAETLSASFRKAARRARTFTARVGKCSRNARA